MSKDRSPLSISDLFRIETENQTKVLVQGLIALESNTEAPEPLEACMRAAHSLKGAARIVNLPAGVELAHAMEDLFVAAQEGRLSLHRASIDLLFQGADLMLSIAKNLEVERNRGAGDKNPDVVSFLEMLREALDNPGQGTTKAPYSAEDMPGSSPAETQMTMTGVVSSNATIRSADFDSTSGVLRITAGNLDRLLGLASESLVASRQLKPFVESLLKIKRLHDGSLRAMDDLRESLAQAGNDERYARIHTDAEELRRLMQESQQMLSQRLVELEILDRRSTGLTQRLYDQALACRMRPFMDGVHRFPRLVRDLGQALGKRIRLEIVGASTQIDRDILEKLDGPLNHLLNNAIDHGIEPPEERAAMGKPPEAVITLAAHHKAGMLQLTISDDGRGIDLETLRSMIVKRQLSTDDMAGKLSESELLEFLFLPGFTMKESVTELSGRGVGLDVVLTMIKQVRGVIAASSRPGKGMQFRLQLPLTLSVIDTLVVTVREELYAFPLAHILATVKVKKEEVTSIEGRQHFHFKGRQVGLATSHQILEGKDAEIDADDLCVVVAGEQEDIYGLIVDGFVGQRELVIQTLDPRLGKIRNISAAALMDDGAPVLILDVDDMLRSLEKITATGRLNTVRTGAHEDRKRSKRVLIVDDSLTVRELERKLLTQHGYEVEVAVDGMDGWNAVRAADFDLVITDIDMPRLDGIGLLKLIRQNPNLKSRPVMIVSYKDREEDRQRGLEAGADYYLTKGSFHDETMLQAVVDLIGEASE